MDRIHSSPCSVQLRNSHASQRRYWRAAFWLVLLAAMFPGGCGWMSVVMYNMNPDDTPADFEGLQDKRVAVVCRPVAELQFADSTVPRDLVRQVSENLSKKVKKIRVVDEREV